MMELSKKDGHTHTPFLNKKSNETIDMYIEKAIDLGLQEYTIAEHAPLVANINLPPHYHFIDTSDITAIKEETRRVMAKYGNKIKIRRGFEVDYFSAHETDTRQFLKANKDWIDEIILAVHFIKSDSGEILPIDYSAEYLKKHFENMLSDPQLFYKNYFDTVAQSVEAIFGIDVPIRIGHLGLVRKFQKPLKLPDYSDDIYKSIGDILQMMQTRGYQLEFNTSGLRDVTNGETYPQYDIILAAKDMGLDIVYGSDAKSSDEVGMNFFDLDNVLRQ